MKVSHKSALGVEPSAIDQAILEKLEGQLEDMINPFSQKYGVTFDLQINPEFGRECGCFLVRRETGATLNYFRGNNFIELYGQLTAFILGVDFGEEAMKREALEKFVMDEMTPQAKASPARRRL